MATSAHTISLAITGKIGDIVYQRVRKGLGNIETWGRHDLQIRRQGSRIDNPSTGQLKSRARIAAATAAYQALSLAERETWKKQTTRKHCTGYNAYVRDFCARHPLEEF